MTMLIPPKYSCYCRWEHNVITYEDYIRVRDERRIFLIDGGKATHTYSDSDGRLIFIDKTFDIREKDGYVTYPLRAIKPRT